MLQFEILKHDRVTLPLLQSSIQPCKIISKGCVPQERFNTEGSDFEKSHHY